MLASDSKVRTSFLKTWKHLSTPHEIGQVRRSNKNAQYLGMLADNEAVTVYNAQAGIASWFLLAGYLVFPSQFASLKRSQILETPVIGHSISTIVNMPIIYLGSVTCLLSTIWLAWLTFKMHKNCIWLEKHIFMPVFTNSLLGLVSTLFNAFSKQGVQWSWNAIGTAIVIAFFTCASCSLFVLSQCCFFPRGDRTPSKVQNTGKKSGHN